MSNKLPLSQADVHALRAILKHTDRSGPRADAYQAELTRLESCLPPSALAIWRTWPSDDLRNELKRWRDLYKVVRTQQGYRTHPYLKTAKRYRKTPEQTRLTSAEVAEYRIALIRI